MKAEAVYAFGSDRAVSVRVDELAILVRVRGAVAVLDNPVLPERLRILNALRQAVAQAEIGGQTRRVRRELVVGRDLEDVEIVWSPTDELPCAARQGNGGVQMILARTQRAYRDGGGTVRSCQGKSRCRWRSTQASDGVDEERLWCFAECLGRFGQRVLWGRSRAEYEITRPRRPAFDSGRPRSARRKSVRRRRRARGRRPGQRAQRRDWDCRRDRCPTDR